MPLPTHPTLHKHLRGRQGEKNGARSAKRSQIKARTMKQWFFVGFLVVCVALEQGTLLHVEATDGGFVKARGAQLMLNGSPYYANGFNAYWLMYAASDPSQRFKVSAAFREATSHGLTVARTWAFSDGGYRPLQYAPGFYNEQMFKVSLTKQNKLKYL